MAALLIIDVVIFLTGFFSLCFFGKKWLFLELSGSFHFDNELVTVNQCLFAQKDNISSSSASDGQMCTGDKVQLLNSCFIHITETSALLTAANYCVM